jgi:hypothetical protein
MSPFSLPQRKPRDWAARQEKANNARQLVENSTWGGDVSRETFCRVGGGRPLFAPGAVAGSA